MSHVAIEKLRDVGDAPPSLIEQMLTVGEKIRQRAFEVFQLRGGADGHSLDDWLQAERDVIDSPAAELIEKEGKFRLRMAIPGFDAKDIHVIATPSTLIIRAENKHSHQKHEGDVYFCEFGRKQLFRRLDLPAPINPDKVSAKVDSGILQLTAEKTVDSTNKMRSIAAA